MTGASRRVGAGLVPVADVWDWQTRAACRGTDPETFFHSDNARGPTRRRQELDAKQVCRGCPVIAECLDWALTHREDYGVWGGLAEHERARLTA